MGKYIQVITTIDDEKKAENMAELLLSRKVCACVQISGPIKSIYWWKGKIEKSEEYYISIKTTKDKFNIVMDIIKENHSYEVPEIISLDIDDGYRPYLDWIDESVKI